MTELDRQIAKAFKLFDAEPSQNISEALLVVEEMERQHKLDFSLDKSWNTRWVAMFSNEPTSQKLRMHGCAKADTAAEAICRAALEALKDG